MYRLPILVFALTTMVAYVSHAAPSSRVLVNHGIVPGAPGQSDLADASYYSHNGLLYFSLPGTARGLRVYDPGSDSTRIVPGTETLDPSEVPGSIAAFDGYIFFVATTTTNEDNRQLLYRIALPNGSAESVGIESLTAPNDTYSMTRATPRPELVTYRGALYFNLLVEYEQLGPVVTCGIFSPFYANALYRIEAGAGSPVIEGGLNCNSLIHFGAGENGLLFRVRTEAQRGTGRFFDQVSELTIPAPGTSTPARSRTVLVEHQSIAGGSRMGADVMQFDGAVFVSGEHDARLGNPDFPAPGPFFLPAEPSLGDSPSDPVETELHRFRSGENPSRYDLFALSYTDIFARFQDGRKNIGSSDPDDFVRAQNSFYLSARERDMGRELFRLTGANATPEMLPINPNGPSNAVPLGEFDGRLWMFADTGAGRDLHVMEEDGTTATPLNLPASVAATARGFAAFNGALVFQAENAAGETETWYARATEPPVITMSARLLINGRDTSAQALNVPVRRRLNLRCIVSNTGNVDLKNVRVSLQRVILQRDNPRLNPQACTRARLAADGASTGCNRTTRSESGLSRYICVATARDPFGGLTRARALGFTRVP